MNIVFEDKNMLVLEKPAKMPVQSDRTDDLDLQTQAMEYMKSKGFDQPYIGLVHRLDRPVGGLVVMAKNPRTAAFLSKEIQDRKFDKTYLAIVEGKPENATLIHYLKKKAQNNTSYVVDASDKKAKKAILHLERVKSFTFEDQIYSLVKIKLETGRHHQIRVQLSHIGHPIWGDTKYNPNFQDKKGWFEIALFASELKFKSVDKQIYEFKLEAHQSPFKDLMPSV